MAISTGGVVPGGSDAVVPLEHAVNAMAALSWTHR